MRLSLLIGPTMLLASVAASANPRPLAMTYPFETLPKGSTEVEQIVDLTPVKAFDTSGAEQTILRSILTTEFEHGLTDRLELGLYFQFSNDPGSGTGDAPLRFDGIKQRLRWRL